MTASLVGLVAGLCTGTAALLVVGGPPRRVALPPRSAAEVVAAAAGVAVIVVVLAGAHLVLALVAVAVVAAAGRELRRHRMVRAADQRADQVLATCDALAADLRAGQPPVTALSASVADWPELGPVAAAAELGADVPGALRALAELPGAAQLRVVAAAWQVGHRSGAGLADALSMAADRLRDDRSVSRVVATEMAAAVATARMLAALPVVVLLLGNGLGGDPVAFLIGTTPGLACLCVGLALEYAGLRWLARIADHVTGRRPR